MSHITSLLYNKEEFSKVATISKVWPSTWGGSINMLGKIIGIKVELIC